LALAPASAENEPKREPMGRGRGGWIAEEVVVGRGRCGSAGFAPCDGRFGDGAGAGTSHKPHLALRHAARRSRAPGGPRFRPWLQEAAPDIPSWWPRRAGDESSDGRREGGGRSPDEEVGEPWGSSNAHLAWKGAGVEEWRGAGRVELGMQRSRVDASEYLLDV